MSFAEQIVQVTPNEYVLPRVGEMKVAVHAFLSPELLAHTDERLWRQAVSCASTPGAIGIMLP